MTDPLVAVYVTVSAVVSLTVNVATPELFVLDDEGVMTECPLP